MAPSKAKKLKAAAAAKQNLRISTRRSSRKKAASDVNVLEPELEDPGGGFPRPSAGVEDDGGGDGAVPASHGAGPAAESTQLADASAGRASERPQGMDDPETEITAIKGKSAMYNEGLPVLTYATNRQLH